MSTGVIVGDFHVGGRVTFVPTYTGGDTSHSNQVWYVYAVPSGGPNVGGINNGGVSDTAVLRQSSADSDPSNDSSFLLGKYVSIEVEFDVTGVYETPRFGPIGPGFWKKPKKVYRRYYDEDGNRL